MAIFKAYKTETIISCGIGGAIITSLNIVPAQFRWLWIAGSILIFGCILLSRLFLKITIDDQGMIVRNWIFMKINIPWSSIRKIQFRRIPGINYPYLFLEVEHQGKLKKFQLPRQVSRYRELVQNILDHTGIPATPALQRFMLLATDIEKPSLRITFLVFQFISFISFIWWYYYAFCESIANYWSLYCIAGYILILLIQLLFLRYRNPDKASFMAISIIGVLILGLILYIGILITIDSVYFIAISLLLGVTIILISISGIGKFTFRKGFGFIGMGVCIGIVILLGVRWNLHRTRTIKEIATIPGYPIALHFAEDNNHIGVVSNWVNYLNKDRLELKIYLFSISLPQYKITSTAIDQDYFLPCLSPDGNKVFIQTTLASTTYRELRLWNAADSTFALVDNATSKQGLRLTFYPSSNTYWSPDSRSFVYLHPVPRDQSKFQKVYRYDTVQKKNELLFDKKEYIKKIYWLDNTTLRIISYDEITTADSEKEIYSLWEYNIIRKNKKRIHTFPDNWQIDEYSLNNKYLLLFKPSEKSRYHGKNYIFDLATFQQEELPFAEDSYFKFVLHPNQDRILALDAEDTKSVLMEYEWKTKKKRPLIIEPGLIRGVSYSPTGDRIAYTLEKEGRYCLYIINADGTNRKKISSLNPMATLYTYNNSVFSWSPDGKQILLNIFLFPFYNQTILGLVTLK